MGWPAHRSHPQPPAASSVRAAIPETAAVRAILGEASNQSDRAMLGVACALRNRGTLAGVYGVNNPVVNRASARLRQRARRAWLASARQDITRGARHFGCPADAPYFLHTLNYRPVAKIGDITFYKP